MAIIVLFVLICLNNCYIETKLFYILLYRATRGWLKYVHVYNINKIINNNIMFVCASYYLVAQKNEEHNMIIFFLQSQQFVSNDYSLRVRFVDPQSTIQTFVR